MPPKNKTRPEPKAKSWFNCRGLTYICIITCIALAFAILRGVVLSSESLMTEKEFEKLQEVEDPYGVLEASPKTSQEELHKKWKKVMVENHPDRFPGDEKKRATYLRINEAYDLQKTKEKRRYYNLVYRFKKLISIANKIFLMLNKPTKIIRDIQQLKHEKHEAVIYNLEFGYSLILAFAFQFLMQKMFTFQPNFITKPVYYIIDWMFFLTFCPQTTPYRILRYLNTKMSGMLVLQPIAYLQMPDGSIQADIQLRRMIYVVFVCMFKVNMRGWLKIVIMVVLLAAQLMLEIAAFEKENMQYFNFDPNFDSYYDEYYPDYE